MSDWFSSTPTPTPEATPGPTPQPAPTPDVPEERAGSAWGSQGREPVYPSQAPSWEEILRQQEMMQQLLQEQQMREQQEGEQKRQETPYQP